MVAHCCKEVQNLPVICGGIANTARRNQWQLQGVRNPDRGLISPFFLTLLMALQLDIHILLTEDTNQLLHGLAASSLTTIH
jgi:hypothetical protein